MHRYDMRCECPLLSGGEAFFCNTSHPRYRHLSAHVLFLFHAELFHSIGRVSEVKDILMNRGTKFQFADSQVKRAYNEDDIIKSVKKLSKLGSGFRTITVGQVVLIVSVPEELDDDHMQIMSLAEDDRYGQYGEITIDNISRTLRWDEERSNRALELLLGKGMIWLDVNRGEKSYWFPR